MAGLSAEEREALWYAIATVRDESPRRVDDADTWDIVAAIEPLIARHVAETLTAAANEAASALGHERGGHTSTYSVRRWLLDRAKAVTEPPP